MDYAHILTAKYPDRSFSVGETYESIVPLDGGDIPPQDELQAAWPQVRYERDYLRVEAERKAAYERDADPVFFRWQRGTATEQDWKDAVEAVRDAHPYPANPKAKKTSK